VANTKSAIKGARKSERRRQRNRAVRSKVRTATKSALGAGGPDAAAAIREAIRIVDKAVTKGVVHRNTAARRKSVLARRLATLA
jgi:small subunit ribosomal protein S20